MEFDIANMAIVKMLKDVVIEECEEKLKCANDSRLETMGRTTIEVKLEDRKKKIRFIIVRSVNPDIIGGIDLQRQFGFVLQMNSRREEMKGEVGYNKEPICILEAKFGRVVNRGDRARVALEVLKIEAESALGKIIHEYEEAFMADNWDIGRTHLTKHIIRTTGKPINVKQFRQPMNLEAKIDETIKNLFENGIIRECQSPWNMPLICIWKKDKKEVRLCLDFRQLNLVTERPAFPMPNVDELLDQLGEARFFSTIDLGNAYYQVELDKESQIKTAFSTKKGQFCFNRMPFGIAAAPGTFQRIMNEVVGNIKGALVYLDDILVFSDSVENHYDRLRQVLGKIREAGLRINPKKCHFLRKEVRFLGHIISRDGICTDPEKIDAIKNYIKPRCVKGLRSFLGICNYYRKFIEGYAHKAGILEKMCGNINKKLIWNQTAEDAFENLKEALTKSPVLGFPDLTRDFILDTDASFGAIGAVLSQEDAKGRERVIAYGSHSLNKHERGYCVTRKELLAIFYFCKHFNYYLYGRKFRLRTDHKALSFMLATKKPITAQFQNWLNFLSSLDMSIEYRKGELHSNADMVSRPECESCVQCETQHEDPKLERQKTRRLNAVENDIVNETLGMSEKDAEEIIQRIHRLLTHVGPEKVFQYMKDRYQINNMKAKIREIISKCQACQKHKVLTVKTKEETVSLQPSEMFADIYVDICGPLKDARQMRYILGIIDQCSKYIVLIAIRRQDENTVQRVISNNWLLKFGCPRRIHMDCGRSFESKAMVEFAKRWNVELCFSSPYHHNTNGQIERQFRTVRDLLNTTLEDRKISDWTEILPEIEFALNSTWQKSINTSPAEFVFGKKIARENWNQQTSEKTETKSESKRTFEVGEKVLVRNENRNKDQERFEGPYQVVKKVHDRRYLLQRDDGRRIERNVEKLKKFLRGGI